MASSVREWIIPETGLFAPALMLVAVRAIAPVAGMPPNRAEPMLPMPWAISSMFGLCRPPVMPSATDALKRDSMAASRAMVKAGAVSAPTLCHSIWGRDGTETAVIPSMPTSMAGPLGQKRRLSRVRMTVPAASPSAAQLTVWKCWK